MKMRNTEKRMQQQSKRVLQNWTSRSEEVFRGREKKAVVSFKWIGEMNQPAYFMRSRILLLLFSLGNN